jgi:hypothetical protein
VSKKCWCPKIMVWCLQKNCFRTLLGIMFLPFLQTTTCEMFVQWGMDVTNIIKPSGPLYPRHLINGVLKKHVTIAVFLFPVPLLAQNLSLHATLTTHFIAFLIRVHLYSRSSGHVGRHLRQVAVPNFDSFFHPKTTFNAFFSFAPKHWTPQTCSCERVSTLLLFGSCFILVP